MTPIERVARDHPLMDATTWTYRQSSCVGKEAFSSPQLANKVQRRRARLGRTYKRKQHVYHCKACGKFHIGTGTKSRQHTTSSAARDIEYHMEDEESMA